MAIELIDKIKPKNGGEFALVDAADVELPDGKRLSQFVTETRGIDLVTIDLPALGLPNIPSDGTTVSADVDTAAIREALANNLVKFIFNLNYGGISFEGASFVVNPSGETEAYQSTGMLSWGDVLGFINIIVNETKVIASARDMNAYMDLYMDEALGGDY